MGLALRSAELAAEAMLRAAGERRELDNEGLRRAYERLWRWRRTVCRGVAVGMSRPGVARVLVPMAGILPGVTSAVVRMMGKESER
jgi:hypothetical protein